ncbi:MAG: HD domain protein, partial [Lachnospiraceae bacterium]|nr:HD domain protein [Lachnospiraceae bacterium]
MLIVFFCILVNFSGKHFAVKNELPLWLDSFGTVFAAYVLGPVSGAIVGCAGNIIYFFWDSSSLAYALTSIFIGITLGIFARKKYFETFFGATSVAGWVTIGSVTISTIINLVLYDGYTGNVWGDGIIEYFVIKGAPRLLANVCGEMYIDFLDKLVTVLAMFFLVKLVRSIRNDVKENTDDDCVETKLIFLLIASIGASLLIPSVPVKAAADEVTYIQRIYDADNGLLCGHANDIVQSHDGILWVGSYSGLYRYNGTTFRFMDEFPGVKNVNCLYVDEEGRLWIGTNDSGVFIVIGNKVVNVLDSSNGLPSDSVRNITQSSDGDYYIGTSDHMAVVRLRNGISVASELPEIGYTQSISADTNGNVAVVTADGRLYILNEGSVASVSVSPESGMSYSSCSFSPDGKLYVGTTGGRVFIYDIRNGEPKKDKSVICYGISEINQIYFDEENVWVLADNGLGEISGYSFSKLSTGDFNSSIERMCVDYQGNLWFASTRHGLLQLTPSSFSDVFIRHGLDPVVVNTTCVWNRLLYIGTDSGVTVIRQSDGEVLEDDLTELTDGVRIRCITNDSSGNLWVCSFGKGLIRVNSSGEIKCYDTENYGIGSRARMCLELSDGTIAVSADTGLSLISDDDKVTTIPYGDELGTSQILSMCEYSDGKLYLGTDGNGIVIYENGRISGHITKTDGLGSGVILRMIYDDETDSIFIVTSNSLCIMDHDGPRTITNFPYSNNYDLVIDDDGEVFVLGSAGIYVCEKSELVSNLLNMDCYLLNSRMGLRGSLTANSWNELDVKGNLYLSTDRGVIEFNIDDYRPDKCTYRIMVSEVRLDGVPITIERGNKLVVSTDVTTIEFVAEIVNYTLDNPKVSYYLEGVDNEYKTVYQSDLGSAVYTNLPAGEYKFHLAILDEDTNAVLEESTYGFVKEKAIYDNDWFIFYVLFVGGLFIGWFTWFLTRLGLQKKISSQQEKLALALKQVQMGNETIMAIARTVDAKDS